MELIDEKSLKTPEDIFEEKEERDRIDELFGQSKEELREQLVDYYKKQGSKGTFETELYESEIYDLMENFLKEKGFEVLEGKALQKEPLLELLPDKTLVISGLPALKDIPVEGLESNFFSLNTIAAEAKFLQKKSVFFNEALQYVDKCLLDYKEGEKLRISLKELDRKVDDRVRQDTLERLRACLTSKGWVMKKVPNTAWDFTIQPKRIFWLKRIAKKLGFSVN